MPTAAAARRKPRQERSRITVEAILGAATRVFTWRGYARASTNAIAEEAGVSVGSLYQYFPDKQSLLAALHERHLEQLMRSMVAAGHATSSAGLEPALRAIIAAAVAQHQLRAPLVRAFARHLPGAPGGPRVATAEFQRMLRGLMTANQRELRIADHDLALFMLRQFGRSLLRAAAESRPGDLANGTMARELLATVMAFLTGERTAKRPRRRG